MPERVFIAIDLKSFYASVECVELGLDPLKTNLVVADASRTNKTICLAVSPSLRARGIPGRARLFDVVKRVKEINVERKRLAPGRKLIGESHLEYELSIHPEMALSYITATPRMAHYIEYSTRIYRIYLKYVAPEDIHVYSIDEVFIDATHYLPKRKMQAREFAVMMIKDVLNSTGITATAGIGTNLYLCKIAMDIEAKHIPADEDGVRIAELDESSYRRLLWTHRPLTDFWRVGRGYASKLESRGILTMGDIARQSVDNEDVLYGMFGVNAELLIDHAWGYESCEIADIKAYKPEVRSFSTGQVLTCPYTNEKAKLVVREMADALALDLVEKGMVTDLVVLQIGYDTANITDPAIGDSYAGEVTKDYYGRRVPKQAHGSANLECYTSSARLITNAVMGIYEKITDTTLLIRRIGLGAARVLEKSEASKRVVLEQMSLFTDYETLKKEKDARRAELEREEKRQLAVLEIQKKFGKNAIIKGTSLEQGATGRIRNEQIGGHKK